MMTITKAYDGKELVQLLEQELGPEVGQHAEMILKKTYGAIKYWGTESAKISPNKIDDMGVPVAITTLDVVVLPAIDQVDGIKGN